MIAQGTDGGSRGSLLEGVMTGKPSQVSDRTLPATLEVDSILGGRADISPLTPEEWFVEGHGINGGEINADGIWIPTHKPANQTHLWCPPPPAADAALEELLKGRHKRKDTYDITCVIPAGSQYWPTNMFEPLTWVLFFLSFTTDPGNSNELLSF